MAGAMAREFEESIENDFSFLEAMYGFDRREIQDIDDDPRDAYLLARFSRDDERIDIAWNELAKSLSILIRLSNHELDRKERCVYFEPFVEFLSKGDVLPIVPQLFPQMTMKAVESVMLQRNDAFKDGIASRMALLAQKLQQYLDTVRSSPVKMVREYQKWYESRRRC